MLKIVIQGMSDLSASEQAKIREALVKGEPVSNSPIFHKKVLNRKYTETMGYSPAQILEKFLAGADGPGNVRDGVIKINIKGFYSWKNTIGWTTLNGIWQHVNKRYLKRYKPSSVFGHVIHETMHRMGWRHAGRHSTSVPYQYGNAATEAYEEYYAAEQVGFLMDAEPVVQFIFE